MGRPLGVTIGAVVLLVGGILQLIVGAEAVGLVKLGLGGAEGAGVSGTASIISGVITLLVALGLFTTARWAWLLTVVVMLVRIVVDVFGLITHGVNNPVGYGLIVNLAISLVILWYFNRPNVKAAFGS